MGGDVTTPRVSRHDRPRLRPVLSRKVGVLGASKLSASTDRFHTMSRASSSISTRGVGDVDGLSKCICEIDPLLTPTFFANQSVTYRPSSRLDLTVDGRYLGKSFLANTGDRRFMTPRSYGIDATAAWRFDRFEALGQIRNLTNRRIITGGYTDGVTSYFYLQATRNYAITLRARI